MPNPAETPTADPEDDPAGVKEEVNELVRARNEWRGAY